MFDDSKPYDNIVDYMEEHNLNQVHVTMAGNIIDSRKVDYILFSRLFAFSPKAADDYLEELYLKGLV